MGQDSSALRRLCIHPKWGYSATYCAKLSKDQSPISGQNLAWV